MILSSSVRAKVAEGSTTMVPSSRSDTLAPPSRSTKARCSSSKVAIGPQRKPPVDFNPVTQRYWVETLGCPKNQVDSDKLVGTLEADGLVAAARPEDADLVVVNTCAFIEAAREESVETVLGLAETRRDGAQLVVTGCMAER